MRIVSTLSALPTTLLKEIRFQDDGKLLIPYLTRFWEYILTGPCLALPIHAHESLVETSLAATRLIGVSSMNYAKGFPVVAKMLELDLPDYLRLAIAHRQNMTSKLEGNHYQSDNLIQDILDCTPNNKFNSDIRSYCLYGRLIFSQAENAILRKEYDIAASCIDQWKIKSIEPSLCELQIIRMKNTAMGRMMRYQGNFSEAAYYLSTCLKTTPGHSSHYHVLHHLADVYYEQGLLEEARELLTREIENLRIQGKKRSKAFRRLLLPFAEVSLRQSRLEEAGSVISELDDAFSRISSPDITDQIGHVCLILIRTRIAFDTSQWVEALELSENALTFTEKYQTFSKRDFCKGVIHLFRAISYFELRRFVESREALVSSRLYERGPWHFIPGIGTYVLKQLQSRIESF